MKYLRLDIHIILCAVLLQTLVTRNNVQCAPTNSDQERKLDSENYKELIDKRGKIVNEFYDIKLSLSEIIDEHGSDFIGKEDDVQNLLGDLKSKWIEIEKLSIQIEKLVTSSGTKEEIEEEKENIKTRNNEYAESLFQAKARKCKSFEETFYSPESKCLPIEDPSGGPCPEKQMLYDGDFNEGICHCVEELGLVFHKESGSCYQLNTQGPCESGEWIILNTKERSEQLAVCEIIPDAMCSSDGRHVFHKDSCWELDKRGPCSEDQIFVRNPDNWAAYDCTPDTNVSHSVGDKVSFVACPSGSKRGKNGQCSSIYRPG